MAKKRHSAEQIVRKLREAAVELARRTVLAEGQGWCGTGSAAIRPAVAASRRIHFRNACTSDLCREAAVVMRQQRSGASTSRSNRGTSVLRSSSCAISIRRPMAAPIPSCAKTQPF